MSETAAALKAELAVLTRELAESRAQQTATADVLKVISRSGFDLRSVLDTLVESAAHLCEAEMAGIARQRGTGFYYAAAHNFPDEFRQHIAAVSHQQDRGSVIGRTLIDGKVVHIPDVLADADYNQNVTQAKGRYRTVLGVPLLQHGSPTGVITLFRNTVQPFTAQQIELVTTFADQAVIAIENARLFEEVQARTLEVTESLEYQTATSDVLNVISRSPSAVEPVLEAIVTTAARLCAAEYTFVARCSETECRLVAANRIEAEHIQYLARNPVRIDRGSVTGRVALERATIHVPDVLADPEFRHLDWQRVGKQRTVLGVPLLRDGRLLGTIILARTEVKPFSDKQIELVTTFADQAVIAIENARLFEEVQARTAELQESLEYQTATSDVLNVISRSPSQIQPVLDTITETAGRLCDAYDVLIRLRDGELLTGAAHRGSIAADFGPLPIGRGWAMGRAFVTASRFTYTTC